MFESLHLHHVVYNMNLTIILPQQHTEFQQSPDVKGFFWQSLAFNFDIRQ